MEKSNVEKYAEEIIEENKRLKITNNTVSISRAEIYARTGLNDDAQKDVELALQECGVISVKPLQNVPNKNYYIFTIISKKIKIVLLIFIFIFSCICICLGMTIRT